jgi:transposase
MMGHRQVEQAALFYEFSLERHIATDHLLRSIDRFVDLEQVRQELAPFYSSIGRPSIDPELMIRMLLIGYCFGIRSERRLCDEVHLNLAYRRFCRLGLNGAVPDHSTFSKNRHGRFRQSDLFRRVFESVLRRCIEERLVGGEGFAVDASLIKADANRQKGIEGDKGLPPEAAGRAIDEYLAVLDDAAFGAATEVTPKFVSPSDPAARWTGAHGGQAFFAYSTNYLVDVENAIIVDVEATTAIRQAEVLAAKRMIERSLERFDLYPSRLLGDSGYGSAEMLGWLVYEHGIEPHVTVFDKSARTDGIFSREDFMKSIAAHPSTGPTRQFPSAVDTCVYEPACCFTMCGIISLIPRNMPVWWSAIVLCQPSSVTSSSGSVVAKPALLTRLSIRLCLSTMSLTATFQPASVVTSRSICSAPLGKS